ncbi:murein L,D-transpeptidase catalytic domain family protein [Vibrio coralliirubri]|uniref:murein L,D-transpeptidase catalytic domain family protein n=1 Tax=Vibrio coralliirubri TaxID=1516159 RepID=UPI002284B514|nr:murein L,D-transpeptidase catalytic domain family protein [Vibrio coralliirubri]MCY9861259.1 murein L,D-transpeptidase catalytic domain family protein [Vibrio coralliirubri]
MRTIKTILLSTLLTFSLSGCSYVWGITSDEFKDQLGEDINSTAINESFKLHKLLGGDAERIIIVDFSLPSEENRFFIINVNQQKIEHATLVSHAIKSGFRKPYQFSNTIGSNMSSVGRFVVGEMYSGKNGLSVRIDGMDKGVNDNARQRYIVIHGATYSEFEFFEKNGQLGRSEGCFAIPMSLHETIIPKLASGTPMYVYN